MEKIINYLTNEQTWPYKWQTLLGAILGVVGTLFVTLIGLLLNNFSKKRKEIRECIRLTEINLALGLNDVYDTERHLNDFLKRLDLATISPLKHDPNPSQYFLSETNFPVLSIHFDPLLLNAKYKSYYVHNKILIIIKNAKRLNDNFQDMKAKYEGIAEKAKFLMQQGATPVNQQREYLSNNENFALFVTDIISQLQLAKKIFAETKIYNLKLLNKQYFLVWCLEGISFKFFLNRYYIESYKNSMYSLDRIDQIISDEVTSIIKSAEKRGQGTQSIKQKYIGDYLYQTIQIIMKKLKF